MTRRRDFLLAGGMGSISALTGFETENSRAQAAQTAARDLTITELTVTPIALPDPPILAASGCHGPYFLRNIVEVRTADGIVGIGETHGGKNRTEDLEKCRDIILGKSAFAYRVFSREIVEISSRNWAGIELACLDAVGKAVGLSLSRSKAAG